jgi:hypothetical protein
MVNKLQPMFFLFFFVFNYLVHIWTIFAYYLVVYPKIRFFAVLLNIGRFSQWNRMWKKERCSKSRREPEKDVVEELDLYWRNLFYESDDYFFFFYVCWLSLPLFVLEELMRFNLIQTGPPWKKVNSCKVASKLVTPSFMDAQLLLLVDTLIFIISHRHFTHV